MEQQLKDLKRQAITEISDATSDSDLIQIYLRFLGKNGAFTLLARQLKDVPKEKRPALGTLVNMVKQDIEKSYDQKKQHLVTSQLDDWADVTIPGIRPKAGHLHLVTQAIEEISSIFEHIGFTRQRYPEIEWEWFSFAALNMPEQHPARDDFETFYIDAPNDKKYGRMVLTPHTSSGQIREMLRVQTPPIRMINIGKTYRPNWDVSHTPMFHQFEGLVIDKGINITHLKGTFEYFAKEFFGPSRKIRLRPFHFQFTEPSFEVDITCGICDGTGCRLCKEGWLELGGSGMVHPNVLKSGGIDPEIYTGYAFGWGIERTYMMKEGLNIDDLRLLYSNDMRFLEQF